MAFISFPTLLNNILRHSLFYGREKTGYNVHTEKKQAKLLNTVWETQWCVNGPLCKCASFLILFWLSCSFLLSRFYKKGHKLDNSRSPIWERSFVDQCQDSNIICHLVQLFVKPRSLCVHPARPGYSLLSGVILAWSTLIFASSNIFHESAFQGINTSLVQFSDALGLLILLTIKYGTRQELDLDKYIVSSNPEK